MKRRLNFLGRLFLVIICTLAFKLYISPVLLFTVKGESMYPNVSQGFHIVERMNYILNDPDPRRGDIVIFYPPYGNDMYIKRIVGLPSEEIVFEGNEITIYNDLNTDGFKLDESYLEYYYWSKDTLYRSYKLAKDEYLVLGDNRNESFDSRFFGPIKKDSIFGRLIF